MASVAPTPSRRNKQLSAESPNSDSRYDRRLSEILAHAAEVFCEKGYAAASMRDLSRATGMSLAGLYYYFESKEKLLHRIQKHTFQTILSQLRERLEGVADPEQRLRIFIGNHLEYFLGNQKGMKVLSHESNALGPELNREIRAIKREYYHLCLELVDAFKLVNKVEFPSRIAVLSLFGMMNWIYTWHNPKVDAGAQELAQRMGDLFLYGLLSADKPKRESTTVSAATKPAAPSKRSASSRS
jgi:AcrR family transcriptional regulator